MSQLSWAEREQANQLAAKLIGTASLIRHRPAQGAAIRAAVIADLDPDSRLLLRQLVVDLDLGPAPVR